MKWTSLNDLRESYLSFFESKGHLVHKSYPLIPENDKTLLLIVAGMAPLKKYFTGELTPPRRRMTTCQKCIRTNDIENVGYTARHGTFFEMLGNFSFGDYFKNEALPWAWEYLTKVLEIPEEKLWPSVYEEDDEAYSIWKDKIGVREDHIVRLGKDDNFWELGAGACGPCSEIYFDRGEKYGCGKPDCKPGCDCDRYMEIWNNVFSQYESDGKGNYTELKSKNIDTGMGLERLACVMQGVDNMFEVDTIKNILNEISDISGIKYGSNPKTDVSERIICDHTRASAFLIADGVLPSNEGRGYVLRRLIRRACRHGRLLGIKGTFLDRVIKVVARENATAYPELTEKLGYITKIAHMEEEKFASTIESGMNILDNFMEEAKKNGNNTLSGENVFKLSDTYGFPLDLTREIAAENGFGIDEEGYRTCLDAQKQRARAARGNVSGWIGNMKSLFSEIPETEFKGYETLECESEIIAIIDSDSSELVDMTTQRCVIITKETPFYGEGGGQVGDTGIIESQNTKANVIDTKKQDGIYLHICEIEEGYFSNGEKVTLKVDKERRSSIARNHSATHLLDAALRTVLGDHIRQAGSYVDDKELRFDFTHFSAMTKDEISQTEDLVNTVILQGLGVTTQVLDIETAKASGAIALFGEKYGDFVRVVKMGDFSSEFCGGTHVDNVAKCGLFRIISESSVAAGTRRITAVCGTNAYALAKANSTMLDNIYSSLKINSNESPVAKIEEMTTNLKKVSKELEGYAVKLADESVKQALKSGTDVNGTLVASLKTNLTVDLVRNLTDNVKSQYSDVVFVVSSSAGDRLTLVCVCGKDTVNKGITAPKVLKELAKYVGGGGGGRPDSATAGAKDPEKLDEAFTNLNDIVKNM